MEDARAACAGAGIIFLSRRDQDGFEDQAGRLREFAGAGRKLVRNGARKLNLDLVDPEHGRPSRRVPARCQRGGEVTSIGGVGSAITDEGVFAGYPAFAEKYPAGALAPAGFKPGSVFAVLEHGCLVPAMAAQAVPGGGDLQNVKVV